MKIWPGIFFTFWLPAALAAEFNVQPGDDLAAVIAQARSGDTVTVERGHYPSQLIIDKPLHLKGINRPTLDGKLVSDVIRIRSPDVIIEGFIIRNSGNNLTAQHAGIYLQPGSDRVIIRDNTINYTLFGLWIEKCAKLM